MISQNKFLKTTVSDNGKQEDGETKIFATFSFFFFFQEKTECDWQRNQASYASKNVSLAMVFSNTLNMG